MGKRIDYRYPPGYSNLPYDSICVNCDERFSRGEPKEYLNISICDNCFMNLEANPKSKRQRTEAESNQVIEMCFDRLKANGFSEKLNVKKKEKNALLYRKAKGSKKLRRRNALITSV